MLAEQPREDLVSRLEAVEKRGNAISRMRWTMFLTRKPKIMLPLLGFQQQQEIATREHEFEKQVAKFEHHLTTVADRVQAYEKHNAERVENIQKWRENLEGREAKIQSETFTTASGAVVQKKRKTKSPTPNLKQPPKPAKQPTIVEEDDDDDEKKPSAK